MPKLVRLNRIIVAVVGVMIMTCLIMDYVLLRIEHIKKIREPFVYVPDISRHHDECVDHSRKEVDVVMFVPSPMHWGDRRKPVMRQFLREKWKDEQVILIFVFGTKTGETERTCISQ